MIADNDNCPCCNAKKWKPYYQGKIPNGAYGAFIHDALVLTCLDCGVVRMDERYCEQYESYKNSNYRNSLKEANTTAGFYNKHDEIQLERLNMFKVSNLRGARVLDVGCAAGSFLDYISGLSKDCVAIEPCLNYHQDLKNKKFELYESLDAAIEKLIHPVTHAFSFSVIEHVLNPLEFLQQIYTLMEKGSKLTISTPNLDDFLIDLSVDYKSFFFRKAHRWYFNHVSISNLAKRAGYKNINIMSYQ